MVAGAARTIRGLRDQERQLLKHVAEREHSVAVLFPTDGSLTIDEYLLQRTAKIGERAENEALTLILLDGTSRQAKNLDHFMPSSIPRVCIGHTSIKSWLDPIRKQTQKHRVCTAQDIDQSYHSLRSLNSRSDDSQRTGRCEDERIN
ncbi:DTW domain containing protein [Gracilaria domingensis]|nr:DTW domain containing protein [Gracilaria domingensis]